jgi:hypothetical protein
VITLHCPLLPSTRNMLAMQEFRRMTRRPLIINCGRGGLVDEADLVEALDLGLISGHRTGLPHQRASKDRKSGPGGHRPAQRNRDASCRMGQRGSRRGGVAPAHQSHREFPCRAAQQRDRRCYASCRAAKSGKFHAPRLDAFCAGPPAFRSGLAKACSAAGVWLGAVTRAREWKRVLPAQS